jgi:hypothetical protein
MSLPVRRGSRPPRPGTGLFVAPRPGTGLSEASGRRPE